VIFHLMVILITFMEGFFSLDNQEFNHDNTNKENINKIDQALTALENSLENSFKKFQNKYEDKMNRMLAKSQAFGGIGKAVGDNVAGLMYKNMNPEMGGGVGPVDLATKSFLRYVASGEQYSQESLPEHGFKSLSGESFTGGSFSGGSFAGGEKALTSQDNSGGGYLVPYPMVEHIQGQMLTASVIRSLARVTTITGDTLELLLEKGKSDVGWVSEVAERPETGMPEFAKIRIQTHQMYAKPRASQKLLDDSAIDLESWMVNKIVDSFARMETNAFIHGDGKGKPRGFLHGDVKLETFKTGLDGEIAGADVLLDAFNAMPQEHLQGSVWLMSPAAMAAVRRLKEASTGNYLWQPGLISGQPQTLLGYPIVVVDEMPGVVKGKASTSIVFGNFKEAYQIVDRGHVHVLRDPYSCKPYVEFYTTKRVGGDVVNSALIKGISFSK